VSIECTIKLCESGMRLTYRDPKVRGVDIPTWSLMTLC
jgi:hypothetical protein